MMMMVMMMMYGVWCMVYDDDDGGDDEHDHYHDHDHAHDQCHEHDHDDDHDHVPYRLCTRQRVLPRPRRSWGPGDPLPWGSLVAAVWLARGVGAALALRSPFAPFALLWNTSDGIARLC